MVEPKIDLEGGFMAREPRSKKELEEAIVQIVKQADEGMLPDALLNKLKQYTRRDARNAMQEMIEDGTINVDRERLLRVSSS